MELVFVKSTYSCLKSIRPETEIIEKRMMWCSSSAGSVTLDLKVNFGISLGTKLTTNLFLIKIIKM